MAIVQPAGQQIVPPVAVAIVAIAAMVHTHLTPHPIPVLSHYGE